METDVLGQLGGLETTEAVRRRLAQESVSFKCAVCAKTNADIIAECEDRCKQTTSVCQDISVPAELNMGWRDELEAAKKDQPSLAHSSDVSPEPGRDDGSSEAELAEGFVQTTSGAAPDDPAAHPTFPTPTVGTQQIPSTANRIRTGNDGVPLWIDRLIVALVILLAAMVLKVLFGI